MCIGGILEPNIITIRLSITAVNQLTHNNLKMAYRWATSLCITSNLQRDVSGKFMQMPPPIEVDKYIRQHSILRSKMDLEGYNLHKQDDYIKALAYQVSH